MTDFSTNPDRNVHDVKRASKTATQELSTEELQEVTELQQRDQEVKSHEQAHVAAGGSHVRGGAHFEYEVGPDGQKYAVEGEVQIDTSEIPGDPESTIQKMQVIRSAALAPANPSAKDRSVAAEATRIENQARQEMLTKQYAEAEALGSEISVAESEKSKVPDTGNPSISRGGHIDLVS